ncbi:hypothetical protein NDU88_006060 [Pleurodeles waltl]|uniref:Uncharacterized protein n=1 Tax=Pleurodeles waltl TaxID=8319 RepID=A0AAV7RKJ0_PLEWA|nr:hypothetical protein NDU88_006060 [Pleurodeles waltl]
MELKVRTPEGPSDKAEAMETAPNTPTIIPTTAEAFSGDTNPAGPDPDVEQPGPSGVSRQAAMVNLT